MTATGGPYGRGNVAAPCSSAALLAPGFRNDGDGKNPASPAFFTSPQNSISDDYDVTTKTFFRSNECEEVVLSAHCQRSTLEIVIISLHDSPSVYCMNRLL